MNRRLMTLLASLAFTFNMSTGAVAKETVPQDAKRLGFVEWIVLDDPELRLKARLDTGANTGSLHATDIEPLKRDGEEWVRFELPLDHHKESKGIGDATLTFERPVERTVLVKRKGAESQRRHVVIMGFCIDGEHQEAQFSLTDRSRFKYPALLGRRFMAGEVIVDSEDSFLAESDCGFRALEQVAAEAN
ncbi:ATP-dependent zinc protease family protein [Hydrocarboniclastica marina]|uniref:Retropepsin-like aspartic endopeptidase domain-containing protein n=1 Tax=Hydrocarboniclastica marina TaxID=2259620 RepID=A0A4P7XL53_9ALTE|nr:RimK/LysX family protein [Hydrocarboniclastica marina]QCF27655.1 hypothetical protein soil367_17950 [Hydrocarboniclastica marina]